MGRACVARDGAITFPDLGVAMGTWLIAGPACFTCGSCAALGEAISCSFCLPTRSAGPQFSITSSYQVCRRCKKMFLLPVVSFLGVDQARLWLNQKSVWIAHIRPSLCEERHVCAVRIRAICMILRWHGNHMRAVGFDGGFNALECLTHKLFYVIIMILQIINVQQVVNTMALNEPLKCLFFLHMVPHNLHVSSW